MLVLLFKYKSVDGLEKVLLVIVSDVFVLII